MKKILSICFFLFIFTSCSHPSGNVAGPIISQNSPLAISAEKISGDVILSSLRRIKRTLDSMTLVKGRISVSGRKGTEQDIMESLNQEVALLNRLHAKNRSEIDQLNRQLKKALAANKMYKDSVAVLKDSISLLNRLLSQKHMELMNLNGELRRLHANFYDVAGAFISLNIENALQKSLIDSDLKLSNMSYYITGTKKMLTERHIISDKGLWPGHNVKLSESISEDKLIMIDRSKVFSIPVNSRNARLISSHPVGSFRLDRDKGLIKKLVIIDAAAFWRISKYLVIVTD